MGAPVRGCYGQKPFAAYRKAARSARNTRRSTDGTHVAPYHCKHCNQFHVGENPDHGKRRPRAGEQPQGEEE